MQRLLWIIPFYLLLTGCPPRGTVSDAPYRLPNDLPEAVLQNNTTVKEWIHHPLHPQNNAPVNFIISALDSQKIVKIELAIYEYQLYKNDQGLPSKKKRTNGLWGTIKTFEPDIPVIAINHSFTFFDGFLPHTNVEYVFSVYNQNGSVTRKMAMFDAGDSPWPTDKILLYATSRAPMNERINLCFLPDTDYGEGYPGFLEDVEALVFQGYHSNNKIKTNKEQWAFYYTQQQTDGFAIFTSPFNEDLYPDFLKETIITGIDAFGLLHKKKYSDGAYTNSNLQFLAQDLFTAEGYNWGTAIHETAHVVFHLSDEYNGCFCFANKEQSNVFKEKKDCEKFNEELGYPKEDCTEIIGHNGKVWYLPEKPPLFATLQACQEYNVANGVARDSCRIFQDFTGSQAYQAFSTVCIMQDDGDAKVPSFRHACAATIDRYYEIMSPSDSDANGFVLAEKIDNIYGYEPVMIMDLTYSENTMEMDVKSITYGVPNKDLNQYGDLHFEWQNGKKVVNQLNLDRPDCVHIHYGEGALEVKAADHPIHSMIVIPFDKKAEKIVCEDYSKGKTAKRYSFDVKNKMRKKARTFNKKSAN